MTHDQKREAVARAICRVTCTYDICECNGWFHESLTLASAALAALEALPRETSESELEFGKGEVVIDTGTYGGKPAVFVASSEQPGPVGDRAPTGDVTKLEKGERVWLFPTIEQAKSVADALCTPALYRPAQDAEGWMPIETAPKDGTAFIGSDGKYAYRTRLIQHYEKFPHEEGGPTFRGLWNKEDEYSVCPWSPKMWRPLPSAPRTDGGE
jgi:hypothetical protein